MLFYVLLLFVYLFVSVAVIKIDCDLREFVILDIIRVSSNQWALIVLNILHSTLHLLLSRKVCPLLHHWGFDLYNFLTFTLWCFIFLTFSFRIFFFVFRIGPRYLDALITFLMLPPDTTMYLKIICNHRRGMK